MIDCLLVGLGNPGDAYRHTRHNVGFDAVDAIAAAYGVSFRTLPKGINGVHADCTAAAGRRIKLVKPMTFMNKSGQTISAACRYYDVAADALFVLYDDLDIASGRIKIKTGGGDAGHNGIKSTIQLMGTKGFHRVRIGIDRPKYNSADYVLATPTKEQSSDIAAAIDSLIGSLDLLITDVAKAQQFFHTAHPS